MNDKDIILCRCEDVSRQDVIDMMNKGFVTIEDLKRQLRIGMGPCQGQNCTELVKRELARFLKENPEKIPVPRQRPLVMGVKLEEIAKEAEDEE